MRISLAANLTILSCTALAAPAPSGETEPLTIRAPLIEARSGTAIPGKYIVKLKEGSSDAVLTKALGGAGKKKPNQVYKGAGWGFRGFASELDEDSLEQIRVLPEASD